MKLRRFLTASLLAVSLSAVSASFASVVESNTKISTLLERQREIAEQVRRTPRNMTEQQRQLVREEQAKIYALIEGKSMLSDLSPEQQVQLMNSIEKVNAVIEGTRVAEENRLLCRRERTVGSNMPSTRCRAKKQISEERVNARNAMEQGETPF